MECRLRPNPRRSCQHNWATLMGNRSQLDSGSIRQAMQGAVEQLAEPTSEEIWVEL